MTRMQSDSERDPSVPPGRQTFATTQWTLVLKAGRQSSAGSDEALATLCQNYWYPLYAYVRRRVSDSNEAQDLTQEFFSQLLEKNYVGDADPERGRFRAFLITSFKHFLANEWNKARAKKRGGDRKRLSLDFDQGESRFQMEPSDELTPEKQFIQQWASTLIQQVLARLRDEFARSGKERQFDLLKGFISKQQGTSSYAETAAELGISEGTAQVAVHRMRKRYRELLWSDVSETVADPGDVDDEIRELFAALAS